MLPKLEPNDRADLHGLSQILKENLAPPPLPGSGLTLSIKIDQWPATEKFDRLRTMRSEN